jgi:2-(1,2-epoxy-1,2-dihydrophenyl)acetyl-CoA isomerase
MSETILVEKSGGIVRLSLNRPQAYNSFTREMALAFQKELKAAGSDPEVRVVVITGVGKAFCAGQDLGEVSDPARHPGFKAILDEHYGPIIRLITQMEKPVLAAVNGVAAGAGANIALACDMVVAVDTASFIQAFSGIGLIPDSGGTWFLPRLIGYQRAMALMMLGEKVSADRAREMGMIYASIPAYSFDDEVQGLATRLSQMPTRGLALTKKALQWVWKIHWMRNFLSKRLFNWKPVKPRTTTKGWRHFWPNANRFFRENEKPRCDWGRNYG